MSETRRTPGLRYLSLNSQSDSQPTRTGLFSGRSSAKRQIVSGADEGPHIPRLRLDLVPQKGLPTPSEAPAPAPAGWATDDGWTPIEPATLSEGSGFGDWSVGSAASGTTSSLTDSSQGSGPYTSFDALAAEHCVPALAPPPPRRSKAAAPKPAPMPLPETQEDRDAEAFFATLDEALFGITPAPEATGTDVETHTWSRGALSHRSDASSSAPKSDEGALTEETGTAASSHTDTEYAVAAQTPARAPSDAEKRHMQLGHDLVFMAKTAQTIWPDQKRLIDKTWENLGKAMHHLVRAEAEGQRGERFRLLRDGYAKVQESGHFVTVGELKRDMEALGFEKRDAKAVLSALDHQSNSARPLSDDELMTLQKVAAEHIQKHENRIENHLDRADAHLEKLHATLMQGQRTKTSTFKRRTKKRLGRGFRGINKGWRRITFQPNTREAKDKTRQARKKVHKNTGDSASHFRHDCPVGSRVRKGAEVVALGVHGATTAAAVGVGIAGAAVGVGIPAAGAISGAGGVAAAGIRKVGQAEENRRLRNYVNEQEAMDPGCLESLLGHGGSAPSNPIRVGTMAGWGISYALKGGEIAADFFIPGTGLAREGLSALLDVGCFAGRKAAAYASRRAGNEYQGNAQEKEAALRRSVRAFYSAAGISAALIEPDAQ